MKMMSVYYLLKIEEFCKMFCELKFVFKYARSEILQELAQCAFGGTMFEHT